MATSNTITPTPKVSAPVVPESKDPPGWEKLLEAIKQQLLIPTRNNSFTGQGTILIDFHQGGITGKKFSLGWKG